MTLAATVPYDAADRRTWDAIVIGAGPAGALAARQLAIAGLSVLLVERKSFPREKVCGGCLNGAALNVLRNVGLIDRIGQLGGEPLRELELHACGRFLKLPLTAGLAVSRGLFDALLVENAIDRGAGFLPETTAVVQSLAIAAGDQDRGPPDRVVELQSQSGKSTTVSGRIVIAADGLGGSSLAALPEMTHAVDPRSRIGLGGHVAAAADSPLPGGTVCMTVARTGYVGMVRQEQGRVNVAAAIDPEFLRACGNPAESLQRLFDQSGFAAPVDPGTIRWQGTPTLTRQSRRVADCRLFVLGDAASYVEPFTGEGIAWALADALEIVPLAAAGRLEWREQLALDWTNRRAKSDHQRRRWCRMLATILRSPVAVRMLMGLLSRFPRLANPVVRKVNG